MESANPGEEKLTGKTNPGTERTAVSESAETVEDLQRGGYRILQRSKGFRFGIDAVLLAWFAWENTFSGEHQAVGRSHTAEEHPKVGMSHEAEKHPTVGRNHTAEEHPKVGMSHAAEEHPTVGRSHTAEEHPTIGRSYTAEEHPTVRMSNPVRRSGLKILDLCSGSGIIPMLMAARCEEKRRDHAQNEGQSLESSQRIDSVTDFTGLELLPELTNMANRSASLNNAQDRIRFVCGDVKEASAIFGTNVFDMVTCNPPYIKAGAGIVNPGDEKAIARHEVKLTLEDVVRESARVLKSSGKLFMVYRPNRISEAMTLFEQYKLGIKKLTTVHPYADKEANLVLLECVKGSVSELRISAPLILYEQDGTYTKALREIYGS